MTQRFVIIGSFALLSFASCAPIMTASTSKTLDIYGAGVVQKPIIAEMDVKITKVTGTATGGSSAVEALKQEAVTNALKDAKADVLVEPQYDTQTKGMKATVTVTGFPATYTGFHQVTKEEIPLIEAGVLQKANTSDGVLAPKRKKILGIF